MTFWRGAFFGAAAEVLYLGVYPLPTNSTEDHVARGIGLLMFWLLSEVAVGGVRWLRGHLRWVP